jgi:RNA polymerase sigma factor (sigma-70 family)
LPPSSPFHPAAEIGRLAYLRKIARNATIDWLRQQGRRQEKNLVATPNDDSAGNLRPGFEPHTSTTPSRTAARVEAAELLRKAVQDLPTQHREAIRMKFYDGMSHKQIAAELNISEGSVRHILRKIRKDLRAVLGRSSLYFSGGYRYGARSVRRPDHVRDHGKRPLQAGTSCSGFNRGKRIAIPPRMQMRARCSALSPRANFSLHVLFY